MSYQSDSWIFNVFQIKWRQSSIPHKIVIWTKHQGAAVEPSILSEMVKCVQVCDTLLWFRHNICDKLNNKYWFIVHWYQGYIIVILSSSVLEAFFFIEIQVLPFFVIMKLAWYTMIHHQHQLTQQKWLRVGIVSDVVQLLGRNKSNLFHIFCWYCKLMLLTLGADQVVETNWIIFLQCLRSY